MIVEKLRALMKERRLDFLYIPSSDMHDSEYVADAYKFRAAVCGFNGSAGTLVLGIDCGFCWSDGRYFIQAEKQLNEYFELMRMGDAGVPTILEFFKKHQGCRVGLDGRLVSESYVKQLAECGIELDLDLDLFALWEMRPALPSKEHFLLEERYSGESCASKLDRIRQEMAQKGADVHLLTTLDDIAWCFNLRGFDIPYCSQALAFALISDTADLYLELSKLSEKDAESLRSQGVCLHEYLDIYEDIKGIKGKVLLDPARVNAQLYRLIRAEIIEDKNPSTLMKAIKNDTEIQCTRNAHLKDGIALSRFIIWLKDAVNKEEIDEYSVSEKLEQLRREQLDFLMPSFQSISAYGTNAASMHYAPTKDKKAILEPHGFYLIDSGGTYLDGTSDVTRTIALGELSESMKKHYTAVLKGMIDLSIAEFLHGCRGINLDILARGPLWKMALDYKCGTGHGVGHVLSVHEGPNGFRWRFQPEKNDSCILEAGMITTDEPGVYLEGEYGIRIENELLCVKGESNEYGDFLHFETLTLAPIDLDGVLVDELTQEEIIFLNAYHQRVYDEIGPYLNEEERAALAKMTAPLS